MILSAKITNKRHKILIYIHLKYSNGSRQDVHLYRDLHAVELNSLISSIFIELQF